jgi:hypothetical protein
MRRETQVMAAGAGLIEPALVVWRGDSPGEFRVRIEKDSCTHPARPALIGSRPPEVGDRVLVAGDSGDQLWIIATIPAPGLPAGPQQAEVREAGGASAAVTPGAGGPLIAVRDRQGALVFEYEPDTRRTTLYAAAGDLALEVPAGALNLRAAGGVRIESGDTVEMGAPGGIGIHAGRTAGEQTRVEVRPEGLGVVAPAADLAAGTVRIDASRMVSRLEKAVAVYGSLEITANRIRQRARRFLTAVEELLHLRAGRFEADVEDDLRLRSGTASLKAKGRVKIDGESIHLG